jgi:class 3 adenylate cyclase
LTILFADLRDSSGHSNAGRQPETIVRLEADLFRAINPVVLACGGTILRYEGDSILVVFGLTVQDGQETRAVQTALGMQAAVRALNRLRAAANPQARPLALPIGIHTGQVSVANLLIPGRREVSVFGAAVNLAKRIQEAPKQFPELFRRPEGILLDPTEELILVSHDTFQNVRGGVFRSFRFPGEYRFRGLEDTPVTLWTLRPAVPVRISFVYIDLVLSRGTAGVLALDVGRQECPGVIDHAQSASALCTALLLLENPALSGCLESRGDCSGPPELVLPAAFDFDAYAGAFLAVELLEGRPWQNTTGADKQRSLALRALADFANRTDRAPHGHIDATNAGGSPFALAVGGDNLVAAAAGPRRSSLLLSPLSRNRRRLEVGMQVIHLAVERLTMNNGARAFRNAFLDGVPGVLAPQALLTDRDRFIYENKDRPNIHERDYYIPAMNDPDGPQTLRCAVLANPQSRLFREWLQRDGFAMTVVQSEVGTVSLSCGAVTLSRILISVPVDRGLRLAGLAEELQKLETQARQRSAGRSSLGAMLFGSSPDGEHSPFDPWYDGRAAHHAYTLVESPHQGTVLGLEDVIDALNRLYGSHPDSRRFAPVVGQ